MNNCKEQANKDNKPSKQEDKNIKSRVYDFRIIAPWYSIGLKPIETVLECNIKSLRSARAIWIILIHLSQYKKVIQTDLIYLFGYGRPMVVKVLAIMLAKGFILPMADKRKTNINVYVPFTAYRISPLGKTKLNELNDLLNNIMLKIDN